MVCITLSEAGGPVDFSSYARTALHKPEPLFEVHQYAFSLPVKALSWDLLVDPMSAVGRGQTMTKMDAAFG